MSLTRVARRDLLGLLALALLPALAGCASTGGPAVVPANEPAMVVIKGALSYRARIALPPDAHAIVEVRAGSGDDSPVIAERRWMLEGKQVPLPFELTVPRAPPATGTSYSVRGAVFVGGHPAWVSDPAAIDPAAERIDVGTLNMLPLTDTGVFSSVLTCGGESIRVGYTRTTMLLTVGGETFEMRPTVAASGARFEAVEDPTTTLWNKGERTTVIVRGRKLPECGMASGARAVYRARGNEPFWSLEIASSTMTLKTPDRSPVAVPTPRAENILGGRRYAAKAGGQAFTVTILDHRCVDDMSGMPYPHAVTVLARVAHGQEMMREKGCEAMASF